MIYFLRFIDEKFPSFFVYSCLRRKFEALCFNMNNEIQEYETVFKLKSSKNQKSFCEQIENNYIKLSE